MSRFVREGLKDEPFELKPYSHVEIPNGGYSMQVCFSAIEEALFSDDASLLKNAISSALESDDFRLQNLTITLIQSGGQQMIFKVSVDVETETSEAQRQHFIAGVPLHPILNEIVEIDHEMIARIRSLEEMEKVLPTTPKHYGGQKTKTGPYVYLTEFCEGFIEVNVFIQDNPSFNFGGDITERLILMNGINQQAPTKFVDRKGSSSILSRIATHQVGTAVRCEKVLSSALNAGDYMYNPLSERFMLQCYRVADISGKNGLFPKAADIIGINVDPKIKLIVFQLLQLATAQERNPEGLADYGSNFTYSFMELVATVRNLKSDLQLLQPEQWITVSAAVSYLGPMVIKIMTEDPVLAGRFYQRIEMLQIALF